MFRLVSFSAVEHNASRRYWLYDTECNVSVEIPNDFYPNDPLRLVEETCLTVVYCVVEAYRKLGLPVAYQIVLALKWYYDVTHKIFSVEEMINLNRQHNPYYWKYAAEVEKLLVLI
jgi:hypothetical protein